MRKTKLVRTSRGFVRSIGFTNEAGSQPKFYLGHDKDNATSRLKIIEAIWMEVEEYYKSWKETDGNKVRPIWPEIWLTEAKEIAGGCIPRLSPHLRPGVPVIGQKYYDFLNQLSRKVGEQIHPSKKYELVYGSGLADLQGLVENAKAKFNEAQNQPGAIGLSLQQAFGLYQDYIKKSKEYHDDAGYLTDNAKKKIDQIRTLTEYLPDPDLGTLNLDELDKLFAVFRNRPTSKRYGSRMAKKSCKNYIGEFARFLKWASANNNISWSIPERFFSINKKVKDVEEDYRKLSGPLIWKIKDLKILYAIADLRERVLILLGLNCSYGADQSGRLRLQEIRNGKKSGRWYIDRVRWKKKTKAKHVLWEKTVENLARLIEQRKKEEQNPEYLLVSKKGRPLWSKTKGGNRGQAIPRIWTRLLNRAKQYQVGFPNHPFNSLRDTSSNWVRKLGGVEMASVHLAHKHQSADRNLISYTNPSYAKLNKILLKLEKKVGKVFELSDQELLTMKVSAKEHYKKMVKELSNERMGFSEIAKITGLTAAKVRSLARME